MFESSVHVLSHEDMDRVHGAAVEILRDVGVRVDHSRLCTLLADHGCRVEGDVVRFPSSVVEDVSDKMRDPRHGADDYFSTLPIRRERIPADALVVPVVTAQATQAHDLETDDLRPATRSDLAAGCRLADALPGVITGHPLYIPQDAPALVRDLYTLITVAENYPYSDFVEIYSPEIVPYFLEAGRVIRGSDEALRADPPFCSWAFLTPPLQMGRHGLDICFMLRDFGMERGFGIGGVMPILGASAPVTLAGYLVMQTAEMLASNVANWALRGKLIGYACGPAALDMRRMLASQSSPEVLLLFLATMDLQRYYGDPEPIFPYALSSDAKIPDVQAGIEKASSATLALLAGSRLMSAGLGVLYMAGIASLAQLVIDHELCCFLERIRRGFEVSEETIGLDMMKRVGIGGSFLSEPHTVRHMRQELFFPEVFDRRAPSPWREDRRGMLEHAKARVQEILEAAPEPSYLSNEQRTELARIARSAEENVRRRA